jgi:glutamate carboxypeptidase
MADEIVPSFIDDFDEDILPEFLEDLEGLVQIDSDTYNREGLRDIAVKIHSLFENSGLEVELCENREYGPTLIGRREGSGARRVVLLGHMDTVFPAGTVESRPFRVKGRRAFGPGIIDMKSGLLLGCYALRILRLRELGGYGEICFVCNSDEEAGSPSSGASAVLVLERAPMDSAIVSRRMGVGTYEVKVRGRAAHAGAEPAHGRSAILELAHKIISMKALEGQIPGVLVNVGMINGGVRSNVVAEHASAQVDVRIPGVRELEELERQIRGLHAASHIQGTECNILGRLDHPPFERSEGTARLVDIARGIASQMGIDLKEMMSGGASDGNTTAAMGIPTLDGLGPVGGHPHADDEYIELDSILPRLMLLTNLISRISTRA